MPSYSHPLSCNTRMITAAIPAMTGIKNPVSPILDLQADLQQVIRHLSINATIGIFQSLINSRDYRLSHVNYPPMPLGTSMILHPMMGPLTLSESIPSNIVKIFASWSRVQIASSSIMSPGSRILTSSY